MLKRVEKKGIYICKLYYFNYYKNCVMFFSYIIFIYFFAEFVKRKQIRIA